MDDKAINTLNTNLEVIIGLLLRQVDPERKSLPLKKQIEILSELGMGSSAIARVLGRKPSYVSKELSISNKSKK